MFRGGTRGFSLIELMITITVIGIMALVAVPNIAQMSSHAHYAKNERNAQNVALLAASARAAGDTNQWTSVDDLVDALEGTLTVTNRGQAYEFSISPLPPEDRLAMAEYLTVTNGNVVYAPAE